MSDEGSPATPIELRVHGVSGTAPESLLARPLVTQVAGDRIAGFFRPRLPEERKDDRPHPFHPARPGAPDLEGYNWGGLTSGSPGRALWLFLLPFTLVNIAPRARPLPADDSRAQQRLVHLTWLSARWLALTLTLLLVVTTAGIGANLAAWQCGYSGACAGIKKTPLVDAVGSSMATGDDSSGWLSEDFVSNALLLGGAVLPMVMLFLLWLVSKRTIDRYEKVDIHLGHGARDEDAIETNLDSPLMWKNERPVRRLRATHMQAGIALSMWVGIGAVPDAGLVKVLAGAVLGYSFVVLAVPSYVGHGAGDGWRRASLGIWALLVATGFLATGALLALGMRDRPSVANGMLDNSKIGTSLTREATALPGFDGTLWFIVLLMFGLLFLFVAVIGLQARKPARQAPDGSDHGDLQPGLLGLGAAGIATAAVLVAAVFSASAFTFAAAWLHTGSLRPSLDQTSAALRAFVVPDSFRMATYIFAVAVGVAVVVVVVAIARLAWGFGFSVRVGKGWSAPTRGVPARAVETDYPPVAGEERDPGRLREVERAMYVGSRLERLLVLVGVLVLLGALLTLGGVGLLVGERLGWSFAEQRMADLDGPLSRKVEAWGAYGALLSLLLVVGLASLAFRIPATRRAVGIIWDVASFWPRACHPLAAPCYAERTVPDLVTRLHHLRSTEHRRVVLAGHSQGTVLSAAALFNLAGHGGGARAVDRISLLTFGCVLRRLYGRYFPVYFGPARMHELQELLTRPPLRTARWINLWRYTDYLGGQVTAGPPQVVPEVAAEPVTGELLTRPPATGPTDWEWHSPDPPYLDRRPGTTTYAAPGRHSDFWIDESGVFQLAVVDLLRRT